MEKEEVINSSFQSVIKGVSLDTPHFEQLIARGLSEETIKKNGYVTFSGDEAERVELAKGIVEAVGKSSFVVPGIYRAKGDNGKEIPVLNTINGMVIPSRDKNGRISGLRIRTEGPGGKKYLHLSSKKLGGPPIDNRIHFPKPYNGEEELIITEGTLKADVATELMGRLVISPQSITAIDCLKEDLQDLNIKRVIIAFDKDLNTNPHVARATAKVMRYLEELGYETGIATWDIDEKGIDDALKAGGTINILNNDDSKEYIEKVFLRLGLRPVHWDGKYGDPVEIDYDRIEWGPIKPLPEIINEPEKFEREDIPEFARDYACEIASLVQGPVEYLIMSLITVISSIIGVNIQIQPKALDKSWRVVVNLWALIVGPPSSFKTPMVKAGMRFLDKHIFEAYEQFKEEYQKFKVKEDSLKLKAKGIEDKLRSEHKKDKPDFVKIQQLENELLHIEKEIEESRPREIRYLLVDSTPEATLQVLSENQSGILIYRDEFAAFLQGFTKKGRETEKSTYLEGFNGNLHSRTDRASRAGEFLKNVCISLMGTIQPGVLESLLLKSLREGSGNDGFIERLQLMVHPELPKTWKYVDREIESRHVNRVERVVDQLVYFRNSSREPLILRFSSEAQEKFIRWSEELYTKIRSSEEMSKPYLNHLGKYNSLLPSLALIFQVCEQIDRGQPFSQSEVSLENLELGIRWCDLLEQHAAKIYSSANKTSVVSAYALLEKIKAGEIRNGFPVRSVYRKGWRDLGEKGIVYKALGVLESVNIARVKKEKGLRGASSPVIEINPEVYNG